MRKTTAPAHSALPSTFAPLRITHYALRITHYEPSRIMHAHVYEAVLYGVVYQLGLGMQL